jgi:hypothetical protein
MDLEFGLWFDTFLGCVYYNGRSEAWARWIGFASFL